MAYDEQVMKQRLVDSGITNFGPQGRELIFVGPKLHPEQDINFTIGMVNDNYELVTIDGKKMTFGDLVVFLKRYFP